MKKVGTKISTSVWLALKETATAENVKICKIIEEGIRLWLADNDKQKRQADVSKQQDLF
jgi:hypothetical protein